MRDQQHLKWYLIAATYSIDIDLPAQLRSQIRVYIVDVSLPQNVCIPKKLKFYFECMQAQTGANCVQSTLVISNSKGLSGTLRDIRTSKYQGCNSEENNKSNNHI